MPGLLLSPVVFAFLLASGDSSHGADRRDGKGRLEKEIAREAALDLARWSEEEKKRQAESRDFLEAFRIEGDNGGCLAYDRARQDCAVTLFEFNNSGKLFEFQSVDDTAGPGESRKRNARAREVMLHALLEPRYLASRLEDSLRARDFRERWMSSVGSGAPHANAEQDTALQRLYREYFPTHFKGRDSLVVHVLASTDSALLDSLWKNDPGNQACKEGGPQNREKECRGKTRLAWRKYPQHLPESLLQSVEHLPMGKTAGPFRTPFGFLLLKPVQKVKIPERSFRECLPLLIEISNLGRWPGKDGKLPPASVAGPKASKDVFTVWLWPAPALGKTGSGAHRFPAVFDTLICKPLRVSREDLPAPARLGLDRLGSLHPGDFIPFHPGEFGVWAFRMEKPESAAQANPEAAKALPGIAAHPEIADALFAKAEERLGRKSASKDLGRFRTHMQTDTQTNMRQTQRQSPSSSTQAGSRYAREFSEWISGNIEILSRL
jgi:hypothetical protein